MLLSWTFAPNSHTQSLIFAQKPNLFNVAITRARHKLINFISRDIQELPDIDKLVHICMYGGLCILLWFEYLSCHRTINSFRMLIGAILLPVTFSGMIELAQAYATENRSGDWLDFIANISGIIIASFLGYYVFRPLIWKNKRNASDSHEQPAQ